MQKCHSMLIAMLIVCSFPEFPIIMGRERFYYHGAVLWNNLNSIVVEAVSFSLFKKLYFSVTSFVSVYCIQYCCVYVCVLLGIIVFYFYY